MGNYKKNEMVTIKVNGKKVEVTPYVRDLYALYQQTPKEIQRETPKGDVETLQLSAWARCTRVAKTIGKGAGTVFERLSKAGLIKDEIRAYATINK